MHRRALIIFDFAIVLPSHRSICMSASSPSCLARTRCFLLDFILHRKEIPILRPVTFCCHSFSDTLLNLPFLRLFSLLPLHLPLPLPTHSSPSSSSFFFLSFWRNTRKPQLDCSGYTFFCIVGYLDDGLFLGVLDSVGVSRGLVMMALF